MLSADPQEADPQEAEAPNLSVNFAETTQQKQTEVETLHKSTDNRPTTHRSDTTRDGAGKSASQHQQQHNGQSAAAHGEVRGGAATHGVSSDHDAAASTSGTLSCFTLGSSAGRPIGQNRIRNTTQTHQSLTSLTRHGSSSEEKHMNRSLHVRL